MVDEIESAPPSYSEAVAGDQANQGDQPSGNTSGSSSAGSSEYFSARSNLNESTLSNMAQQEILGEERNDSEAQVTFRKL